jgi:hypothetical protein
LKKRYEDILKYVYDIKTGFSAVKPSVSDDIYLNIFSKIANTNLSTIEKPSMGWLNWALDAINAITPASGY